MDLLQRTHITRGGVLQAVEAEPVAGSLDLYRITDRCNPPSRERPENLQETQGFQGTAQTTKSGQFPVFIPSEHHHSALKEPTPGARFLDGKERALECPSPVLFRRSWLDNGTGEVSDTKIERKSCNKKSCPVCGPLLRKRFVGHFANIFVPLPRLAFLTLTLDPKIGISSKDSRKYIVDRWSVFRKRIHRRGKFVFLGALESHKSDYAHLHVLCSLPDGLLEEEILTHWFQVGGGIVMDFQDIREEPEKVVGYVIKYVFKDAQEAAGRRSMLCSKGVSYYGKKACEERKSYAEGLRKGKSEKGSDGDVVDVWEPMTHGVAKGSEDTPSPEDVKRFRVMANSLRRTTLYVSERGGKPMLTYYDVKEKCIRTKELREGLTRSMISKEIGRIRAQQSIP